MKSSQQNQYLSLASKILMNLLLFFMAFSLSFHIRRFVDLIPQNKHGIENQSNVFSESGYLSLIGMIVFTVLFYLLLKYLEKQRQRLFRLFIISIATLSVFFGVIAPSVAGIENNVDTFHHGEQLSPAKAFEQGKEPYKDIFFLRGAGEDVIAPWLSFKIFGESMGSYYFLTKILQIIATIAFFFLLHSLFKSNLKFLLASLWFLSSQFGFFYSSRDIFTWLALLLVFKLIYDKNLSPRKLFLLGVITSSSIFYAFDRGVYLHVLFTLTCLLFALFAKTAGFYSFSKENILSRVKKLWPLLGGYAITTLVIGMLLGLEGFMAFLRTTYQASKYQGILFNHPFPQFNENNLIAWLPVLVLIGVLAVIFNTIRQEKNQLSKETVLEVVLLIFSVVFLRSAVGRPDPGHIAYGTIVLFILLFIVAFRRIEQIISASKQARLVHLEKSWPVLLILVMVLLPPIVNYYKLPSAHQRQLKETKIFLKSTSKPDEFWMTKKVKGVTQYIKDNTEENDYLFVMSSDAVFYYTTGLKNPSRFYISWFADPDPLEKEMLESLKTNPPKVIIYETGLWDGPDSVWMRDRLPNINEWVLQNYQKEVVVEDTRLLIKE